MSLKDIEKLKEKVEKDPNSKLFVPLAEEYRKEGMLEEAIDVLQKGLEKQPGYMSARVSLGKIYIEKGMVKEAQSELESVIKSIPDNLYAHKKLAEIYRDTGEKDLAIKSFKAVLKLNPMDEDALSKLKEIEGGEPVQELPEEPPAVSPPVKEEAAEPEKVFGEVSSEQASEETAFTEETQAAPVQDAEELAAFKQSIFSNAEKAEDDLSTVVPEQEGKGVEIPEEQTVSVEEISFGDVEESLEVEERGIEDVTEITMEEVKEEITLKDKKAFPVKPSEKLETVEDADEYISKGNYMKALDIYRNILLSDPDNKKVFQRAEELKTLLKLMGKDKEALISRLNTFLEGIKKRRDEFFRSS